MMVRICIDIGHGGSDPGASYKGRKEKDDNLKLGLAVSKEFRRHGILVDETRTTDITLSLEEKVTLKTKRNMIYLFPSIEMLLNQNKQMVETFPYINQTLKAKNLAHKIQKALVGVGFTDRGVKRQTFMFKN